MSVHKANRFIRAARAGGWETSYKILSRSPVAIVVVATRAAERLEIEWVANQLNGSPKYSFHEMSLKIHSRKDAERILSRTKPDLDQYHKWQRRKRAGEMRATKPTGEPGISNEMQIPDRADLPFDIEEDSDSTILKAIRGNTILFINQLTGNTESVFVPHKISGGKDGVRVFNWDTENVFFLAESPEGRAWLSFMDSNGQFRAVHLDRILAVV